jgi:hypothetical protein
MSGAGRRSGLVRLGLGSALAATALVAGNAPVTVAPARAKARGLASKLRPTFEENRGQTSDAVRFVVRAAGATTWLTDDEAVFAYASGRRGATDVLRMSFVGGDARAPQGRVPVEAKSSYVGGGRPIGDVPHFGEVVTRDVYPGVDVRWHGETGALEYDVVLAPHVDPSVVRVALKGAESLRVRDNGDLAAKVGAREIVQSAPVAYQMNGAAREPVAASFEPRGTEFGFRLGAYDASRPVVIDPTLAFATYLGGAGDETVNDMVVDPLTLSPILCGSTTSIDFPLGFGHVPSAPHGRTDAVVAKLHPSGAFVEWALYFGGSGFDEAFGLAVDASRRVWIAGQTDSTNFPTLSPTQSSNAGQWDGFVAAIDADGNGLLMSTYIGGSGDDYARGVAAGENLFVTGFTNSSTDFPLVNASQATYGGGDFDGFLTSWPASNPGSGILRSTYVGGSGDDRGVNVGAIAGSLTPGSPGTVDVIVNGGFETGGGSLSGWGSADIDAPTSPLGVQATGYSGVLFDIAAGLGGHALHSGFGGGAGEGGTIRFWQDVQVPASSDDGRITFDWRAAWNLEEYADRTFDVQIQPFGGGEPVQSFRLLTAEGGGSADTGAQSASIDVDLTDFAGDGMRVEFVLTIPEEGGEFQLESGEPGDAQFVIDNVHLFAAKGGVVVVGKTNSLDFPRIGTSPTTGAGSIDVFLTRYDRDGGTRTGSSTLGGKAEDEVVGVGFSPTGELAICGKTNSLDFPRVLATQAELSGSQDGFVVKLANGGGVIDFSTYLGGAGADSAAACSVDALTGDVFVAGKTNSLDFPRSGDALQSALGGVGQTDATFSRFGTITNVFGVQQPGTLLYSSYLGGPDDDSGDAVAATVGGSIAYIAGKTNSLDFPRSDAALQQDLSGESDAFVAKVNISGPLAAGSLVVDVRSPDTVALEWRSRASIATHLVVERAEKDGGSVDVALLPPATTSFVDTGLEPDTSYTYSVVAVEPDGTRTSSIAAGATTLPYAPDAPIGLSAVVTGAKVALSWTDASANETGFDVQRATVGGPFATVARVGRNATRHEATQIAPGDVTARWRVVAVNRGGSSAASNEVAATTTPTLALEVRSGALHDAKAHGADRFAASGRLAGAEAFDPNVQALRIELGDAAGPLVLAVPAGSRGWTLKRGVLSFSSARSSFGGARFKLDLNVKRGTFSLSVAGFDFQSTPSGAVTVGMALGDQAGAARSTWARKAAGKFVLR